MRPLCSAIFGSASSRRGSFKAKNQFEARGDIPRGNPATFLGLQKNVGDFEMPKSRYDCTLIANAFEERVRLRRGIVFETPAQRSGRIDDQSAHRRPSHGAPARRARRALSACAAA